MMAKGSWFLLPFPSTPSGSRCVQSKTSGGALIRSAWIQTRIGSQSAFLYQGLKDTIENFGSLFSTVWIG
jgi:hypothetical protein